jgi:hypothetical protein
LKGEAMMTDDDRPDDPINPSRDDGWVRDPLAEVKKREAQEMPSWFIPVLAGGLLWVGIGIWLMHKANWPYAFGYGDHCPYGFRGCQFLDIVRSPALLKHPTGTSLALFAWFMTIVVALFAIIIHAARRKPLGQSLLLVAVIAACFAIIGR